MLMAWSIAHLSPLHPARNILLIRQILLPGEGKRIKLLELIGLV
jgi:hypothetical protein